ncbi:MAG: hypothetical protein NW203_01495 [Hyphomonadaceae bacterium]|nr:hypothetical protein [Hyphomonadaceae bacterium]
MRVGVIAAALACMALQPAWAQNAAPSPVAEEPSGFAALFGARRDSPFGAQRIGMGYQTCLDSNQGLADPATEPAGRPLILWWCHDGDNQRIQLVDGVLYVGAARRHVIEPMPRPESNACDLYRWTSQKRRYDLGVCVVPDAPVGLNVDAAVPDLLTFVGVTPVGGRGPTLGAPLRVAPIPEGATPQGIWERDRRTGQIKISGSDLCITPPSQDMGLEAPLVLDSCEEPFRLDPANADDGPRRSRAIFQRIWRRAP